MNGPKATSALSPFDSQLRTLVGAARKSHSCQYATSRHLFDHLLGAREQRRGHVEAEHLAVVRLMTKSNLVGCSTRDVAWFRPTQSLVDIGTFGP
jgi:hypothetical protein